MSRSASVAWSYFSLGRSSDTSIIALSVDFDSAGDMTVARSSMVSSKIIFAMNLTSSVVMGIGRSGVGWPASCVNSRTASASVWPAAGFVLKEPMLFLTAISATVDGLSSLSIANHFRATREA
jgi:hypothetical protein